MKLATYTGNGATRSRLGLLHQLSLLLMILKPLRIHAWTNHHVNVNINVALNVNTFYEAKPSFSTKHEHILSRYYGKPDDNDPDDDKSDQDTDIARRRAISALSQPSHNNKRDNGASGGSSGMLQPPLDPLPNAPHSSSRGGGRSANAGPGPKRKPTTTPRTKAKMHPSKKYLHAPPPSSSSGPGKKSSAGSQQRPPRGKLSDNKPRNSRPPKGGSKEPPTPKPKRLASMLPPPLKGPGEFLNDDDDEVVTPNLLNDPDFDDSPSATAEDDDGVAEKTSSSARSGSGGLLSSWEQFLGTKPRPENSIPTVTSMPKANNDSSNNNERGTRTATPDREKKEEVTPKVDNIMTKLPSIQDLFPPDLTLGPSGTKQTPTNSNGKDDDTDDVSALFPRPPKGLRPPQRQRQQQPTSSTSSEPIDAEVVSPGLPKEKSAGPKSASSPKKEKNKKQLGSSLGGVLPVSDLFYRSSQSQAIGGGNQTGSASSQGGAKRSTKTTAGAAPQQKGGANTNKKRKMVRRGMEMLVGGVPVNADPPQRNMELSYDPKQPWYKAVSVNTLDFGPFFHDASELTENELGLFCEFFVYYTMKWDVCPNELRKIVEDYLIEKDGGAAASSAMSTSTQSPPPATQSPLPASQTKSFDLSRAGDRIDLREELADLGIPINIVDMLGSPKNLAGATYDSLELARGKEKDAEADTKSSSQAPKKGFGKPSHAKAPKKPARKKRMPSHMRANHEYLINMGASLTFDMGVSIEELQAEGDADTILRDILREALRITVEKLIEESNEDNKNGLFTLLLNDIQVEPLQMTDQEDGNTNIVANYQVLVFPSVLPTITAGRREEHFGKAGRVCERVVSSISEGDFTVACAAVVRNETRWSPKFREWVCEEFLFQEDDEDKGIYEDGGQVNDGQASEEGDIESLTSEPSDADDDGQAKKSDKEKAESFDKMLPSVYWDCSETNALNAPYEGKIGHRLLQAMQQHSKENPPKVIAIGDVHGCVDELQDLLRQCDYHPGDLILFLGDLVSKGPASVSVVKMAREIGAVGVRGNHDFEVIRWHQAIKSGVDRPVVGSEHFHVATCLNKPDVQWMYNLPWYILSKDLSALFVHAGFVSGIRLAKQNPRLMMNMRSILPDGTVTSKFFNNWPWARLWDGPQTVYFGHDADRGLQQYEHAIGLDTGCVYGGRLTACLLPEKRLVSVSARKQYFKYRRRHYD